jgi:hypothetical protein
MEDNIKVDLGEIECGCVYWVLDLSGSGGSYEHSNKPTGSIKSG